MKNVYIVTSPLQILNATEAKFNFNQDQNWIVLFLSENSNTNKQMNKLIKFAEWDRIIYIPNLRKLKFMYYCQKIKKISKALTCEKLFIGDYCPLIIRIFAANIKKDHLILMDDGTATITVQNDFLRQKREYKKDHSFYTLKKNIAKSIFKLKIDLCESIDLFTMFNLSPILNQKIYKNEYALIKKQINLDKFDRLEDTVFFIGGSYVEKKELTLESYVLSIFKIVKRHPGKKIIYIPHRKENNWKLKELNSKLKVEIDQFDNIIECEFLFRNIYPMYVVGFFSTALITMKKIYKDADVTSYIIDSSQFTEKEREVIKNKYSHYINNEGVSFEDLD